MRALLASGVQPSHSLLLVSEFLQSGQWAGLPCLGPHNCGVQCSSDNAPPQGVCPLPLNPPPRGTGSDLAASLPFLPSYVWIFLIALVAQKSFCQSLVSFQ